MSASRAGTAPRARVDVDTLADNVRRTAQGRPDAAVDGRRDACGHGIAHLVRAARAAGVATVLTEADDLDEWCRYVVLPLSAIYGLEGAGAPALSLSGPVLSTKSLVAGEGVSYGYVHRAAHDTRIALVSGGYAHGVPRSVGGSATVRIGEGEFPIVGRVAMDVCVVDIGNADVVPGNEAVFLGAQHPRALSAWADASGLTEVELVAAVGLHAPRGLAP